MRGPVRYSLLSNVLFEGGHADRFGPCRAHRIGQIRDVHIYRFISEVSIHCCVSFTPSESDTDVIQSLFCSCDKHTVEEALLRKANQKRSLDEIVIQKGEFDWRSLFGSEQEIERALEGVDDADDARAAQLATREAREMEGLDDLDFGYEPRVEPETEGEQGGDEGDEGGTAQDYMLRLVELDRDFFSEWKI